MRHRKSGKKLNMSSSHRQAMFRNMVTSLLKHDRIRTTNVRAKELRRWADHIITLAKRGDLHARRQALSIVREKDVVHKLFEDAGSRFGKVSGGYTRITKLARRPGDAASVSLIELISSEIKPKKKKATKTTAPAKVSVAKASEEAATSEADTESAADTQDDQLDATSAKESATQDLKTKKTEVDAKTGKAPAEAQKTDTQDIGADSSKDEAEKK